MMDICCYFGDDFGVNMICDGNFIFIFEVVGLCIGYFGYFYYKFDDSYFVQIGWFDIVMVLIDGIYIMLLDGVVDIIKRLCVLVVLLMYCFVMLFDEFMCGIGQQFEIDQCIECLFWMLWDILFLKLIVIIFDGV